jgi:uncharacterized membrane protein (UPF0182 family)
MQLPGETHQEFVLQRSFTPRRKSGILSSFVVARNDGDNYGKLIVYNVADASAPSGFKAASAIESDQFISSQFTLLGQGGSDVEKGNVQLIPIGDAVLYVRPIWITGQGTQPYPRYRFTAAVIGDRAVLGYDVQDAITALVTNTPTRLQRDVQGGRSITAIVPGGSTDGNGATSTTTTTAPSGTQPPSNATAAQLLAEADAQFRAADAALAAGKLGEYQAHISQAQTDVRRAAALLAGGSTSTTTKPAP